MNKEQILQKYKEFTLYDATSYKETRAYKANLKAHHDRGSTTDHLKLIAPFGHPLKFKADFYYFESENTPISEQILEEMGFAYSEFVKLNNGQFWVKYTTGIRIVYQPECNILTINNYEKNLNANQLFTLITLLS